MQTIWVIGSFNADLVVGVQRFPDPGETLTGTSFETYFGGKGGNQAMALTRLGANPRVGGCVGNDSYGKDYKKTLETSGADTDSLLISENEPTGTALIEVDATGQNRIVVVPGANKTLTREIAHTMLHRLKPGDLVLVQLEIPLDTVWHIIETVSPKHGVLILDPAPAADIPQSLYSHITWITPNEHEAHLLTGQDTSTTEGLLRAGEILLSRGVQNAVIKAGKNGAMVFQTNSMNEHEAPVFVPGFPVDVIDTTAAGDTFNGAFAWGLARGHSPGQSVLIANAAAALSVTGKGAQEAMPTEAQVLKFLRQQGISLT